MSKDLQRSYQQMKLLKIESLIDDSLNLHFKGVACQEWKQKKQDEYYSLYPLTRVPTAAEKELEYKEYLERLDEGVETVLEAEYPYSDAPIEYEYCEWVEPIPDTYKYLEDATKVVDTTGVPGYYAPDICTPTYEQFLNGETCPEYSTIDDILSFKEVDESYATYKRELKVNALNTMTVVTASGKEFYADDKSRVDITAAVSIANRKGITSTPWKLVTGWGDVTLTEMEEAEEMALNSKGGIIG